MDQPAPKTPEMPAPALKESLASVDAPTPYVRTLADIHRDVEFAQTYRLEFIKHTMSIAAGVFVFTITFRKDIIGAAQPEWKLLLIIGWFAMIVSLLGGLGHLVGWDRYFITFRDFAHDPVKGKETRHTINCWRRWAMRLQLGSFALGVILITVFCVKNF
jgi:hypothetical protein